MSRVSLLLVALVLAGCEQEQDFHESLGVLTVTPMGPIELSSELAMDGTDVGVEEQIVLFNEGPGTIKVLSARVVQVSGGQDWDLLQTFEGDLRRGQEADLIVRYAPSFASEATAAVNLLIEGSFALEEWDGDQAQVLLEGSATEL